VIVPREGRDYTRQLARVVSLSRSYHDWPGGEWAEEDLDA
jgi:hypothetical protein